MFLIRQTDNENRGTCHRLVLMARFFVVLFSLLSGLARAAPYTPHSDDQILVRLSPAEQAVGQAAPIHSEADAIRNARQWIDTARSREDARFLGYAQAVLSPYLSSTQSAPVQLLQAEIEQYQHAFPQARLRLTQLLNKRPDEGQAWLMLANLDRIQGRFDTARQSCQRAATSLPPTTVIICLASIQSMTGQLEQAWSTLQRLEDNQQLSLQRSERQWLYTLLAEMAIQQGLNSEAHSYLERALQPSPNDPYLRYLQSDLWLSEGAHADVISSLQSWQDRDNALLRLAVAAKRSQHPDASRWREAYRSRLQDSQRAGRSIHHREQARFLLSVMDQPEQALQAAQANWQEQRELSDLRILLASAVKENDPQTLQGARDFMDKNNLRDVMAQQWTKEEQR